MRVEIVYSRPLNFSGVLVSETHSTLLGLPSWGTMRLRRDGRQRQIAQFDWTWRPPVVLVSGPPRHQCAASPLSCHKS